MCHPSWIGERSSKGDAKGNGSSSRRAEKTQEGREKMNSLFMIKNWHTKKDEEKNEGGAKGGRSSSGLGGFFKEAVLIRRALYYAWDVE